MMRLLVRVPLLLRGVLVSLGMLTGVGLGAAWPVTSAHASSNWWWRRLVARDIAYLHTAASRCVNDTLIAIRMQGPGAPLTAEQRTYATSVLALCREEYPTIVQWQPPAPQRRPQAAVAEKVRQELWGLRLAWLQAMSAAQAYLRAMSAPPNIPYRLMIPAIPEVVDAASTVRAMELHLRHEWGLRA